MSGPRAVLLVKVDTLGDLVLAAPLLRVLRAAWPATRLTVVIRRAYLDLAPLLAPGVEWLPTTLDPFNRSPAADPAELTRLRETVTALAPDVLAAATSRRNWLEIALAAAAPAARRLALGDAPHDEFFDTQLRVQLGLDSAAAFSETLPTPAGEPDWQRNFRLADALLGHAVPRTPPRFAAPDAPALLASLGLTPGRYVVCAAAGFANVALKTWPADRFAAALAHLRDRHGLTPVLIGHEGERTHLESVARALPPAPPPAAAPSPVLWLGRDGDLPQLAALIAPSALYFGNDTGAMHLAAALDVPVAALFGGGTWPRFVPAARRGVASSIRCRASAAAGTAPSATPRASTSSPSPTPSPPSTARSSRPPST